MSGIFVYGYGFACAIYFAMEPQRLKRKFILRSVYTSMTRRARFHYLLLSLVSGIIAFACPTGVDFSLEVDSSSVNVQIEETRIQAPVAVERIAAVHISGADSPLPSSLNNLELSTLGSSESEQSTKIYFPSKISFPFSHKTYAIGDWSSEHTVEKEVYYQKINIVPPFRITGTLTGPALGFRRLALNPIDGDVNGQLRLEIRSGLINNDVMITFNDKVVADSTLERSWSKSLATIVRALLCGLSLALLLIAALGPRIQQPQRLLTPHPLLKVALLGIAAIFTFAGAAYISLFILEGLPHFQDDLGYIIRARWILEGLAFEPYSDLSRFLNIPFTVLDTEGLKSQYSIGWPLLLSPFIAVDQSWLAPPFFAAITAIGIALLSLRIYSATTALCSVIFFLVSPIAQLLSGSLLAHAATTALIVWHFVFLQTAINSAIKIKIEYSTRIQLRTLLNAALAFVLLGLAFCCRPLTALAFAAPASFLLISTYFEAGGTKKHIIYSRRLLLLISVLGGLLGAAPALIDNYLVTGSPSVFAYHLVSGHGLSLENFSARLDLLATSINLVLTHAFPWAALSLWPLAICSFAGLFIPLIAPAVSKQQKKWSIAFAICVLSLPLAYLGHSASGNHGYGPRFYFESLPFLFILSARSLEILITNRWIQGVTFTLLLTSGIWVASKRLPFYQGYNSVSSALESKINLSEVPSAAIVVPNFQSLASLTRVLPRRLTSGEQIFFIGNTEIAEQLTKLQSRPVYLVLENRIVALLQQQRVEEAP